MTDGYKIPVVDVARQGNYISEVYDAMTLRQQDGGKRKKTKTKKTKTKKKKKNKKTKTKNKKKNKKTKTKKKKKSKFYY